MKKAAFVILLVMVMAIAFVLFQNTVQCQPEGYSNGPGYGMGPGMMWGHGYGPRDGGWYCPYCGSHMGWYGQQYRQSQQPIDEKEAASLAAKYIKRNPNLKVGAVKSAGDEFEVEIRTKNNELVDKIRVDKYTGWIRSAY